MKGGEDGKGEEGLGTALHMEGEKRSREELRGFVFSQIEERGPIPFVQFEVFKVLIQHKGVEKPQLDGLRDLRSISFDGL